MFFFIYLVNEISSMSPRVCIMRHVQEATGWVLPEITSERTMITRLPSSNVHCNDVRSVLYIVIIRIQQSLYGFGNRNPTQLFPPCIDTYEQSNSCEYSRILITCCSLHSRAFRISPGKRVRMYHEQFTNQELFPLAQFFFSFWWINFAFNESIDLIKYALTLFS